MSETKAMTEQELLAADPMSLTNDQLNKRIMLANLRKSEREYQLIEEQNNQYEEVKLERKRKAVQRNTDIQNENNDRDRKHAICNHKSGGKGLAGLFNGDGSQGYSVSTQMLPTGEMYHLCVRCFKEWHLPKRRDVINGVITLDQFTAQIAQFNEVASWDKRLFGDSMAASVTFNIPALNMQRMEDDRDFPLFLAAQKGKK